MSFDVKYLSMKCINCGSLLPFDPFLYKCPKCGGLLDIEGYDNPKIFGRDNYRLPGVWKYHEALPTTPGKQWISLDEGRTPLVRIPGTNAWIKFEGSNPTGSFKDRGMAVAINIAKHSKARIVVAASTGNTASSMAAYASRARLKSLVVIPKGRIASGKMFQSILHGSIVVEINDGFDEALSMVQRLLAKWRGIVYSANSLNPVRLEGQKTIAYEIYEQLGESPDYVIVPVGNAGNIAAIWKGFKELKEWGYADKTPIMIGVQAEGSSPLYKTWKAGSSRLIPESSPVTLASAIRIGRPVNWRKALIALKESNGFMLTVTDKEIVEAVVEIARVVGLGVEPSSATSYAAWKKLVDEGRITYGDNVVLIATGHALKDPGFLEYLKWRTVNVSTFAELDSLVHKLI